MKAIDEGIFLHRSHYSDSSLITTFFTKQKGLQRFVFRGGKKKAHQMYPLSVSELNYFGRNESNLMNLTSAQASANYSFQFDPVKSTIAFFIAECIRKCVIDNDFDPVMFEFLKSEIQRLNDAVECSLFPIEFMVSFSEVIGLQPLVEKTGNVFNLDEGTINKGSNQLEQLNRIEEGAHVVLIASLIDGTYQAVAVNRETREKALETMMMYYRIHVPRIERFETYEIVREILSA